MELTQKEKLFVGFVVATIFLAVIATVCGFIAPAQSKTSLDRATAKKQQQPNRALLSSLLSKDTDNKASSTNDKQPTDSSNTNKAGAKSQPRAASTSTSQKPKNSSLHTAPSRANKTLTTPKKECDTTLKESYKKQRDYQLNAEETRWSQTLHNDNKAASVDDDDQSSHTTASSHEQKKQHQEKLRHIKQQYRNRLVTIDCS